MMKALWLIGLLALAGASSTAFAQARPPIDLPIEMDVPIAPTPVKADGKTHLVYELHLTNFSSSELTLARVEVLADAPVPWRNMKEQNSIHDSLAQVCPQATRRRLESAAG